MIETISTPHAHATHAAHHFFHDLNRRKDVVAIIIATALTHRVLASVVGFQIRPAAIVVSDNNVGVHTAKSIDHCDFHRRSRQTRLRYSERPLGCPRIRALRITRRKQHPWHRCSSRCNFQFGGGRRNCFRKKN